MKQISIFLSLLLLPALSPASQSVDPQYYELQEPQIQRLADEQINFVEPRDLSTEKNCLGGVVKDNTEPDREFDLNQLINLGEKIWQIVKDGEPELNFKSQAATAFPAQAQCLFNLSNWSIPQSTTYKISYKNGFGMEVISMKYKLIYTFGGQFDGRGQYLANVSIHPAQIYVGWGFKFDANVHIQDILNVGSQENPEAGMQMALEWSVGSVMNKHQSQEVYFIQGSGPLTHL